MTEPPDRYRRRAFDDDSTDPQHVIAQALARYHHCADIGPATWWEAGAAVRALNAKGLLADRRKGRRTATNPKETR